MNQTVSASDYVLALQIRGVFQKRADELFDHFDVIAAPTLPVAATPLSTNLETDLSYADPVGGLANLCGLPAISVPCGLTSKKLPASIQFLARGRNDHLVVAAASMPHTKWHLQRPPIS